MTRPATPPGLAAASLLLAALAGPSAAQGLQPVGDEWIVNGATNFTQEYGRVALDFHGDRMAFAWETVLNHEVMFRVYDGEGNPLTGDIQANTTMTTGRQDEPAIVMNDAGRFLVAWTDNAGFDGAGQGIFARIFEPDGAPVTGEFQVNVESPQSQWEPLVAATPTGEFVVAWSGRSNGDAFYRLFDDDGTPLTGDVQINTLVNNAQIDVSVGVTRDGRMLAAFVDFGGNGTGGGQSVFGRLFQLPATPLSPSEGQMHVFFNAGDQREPRVVGDRALNRFVAAWQDNAIDGSGFAVMCRRFTSAGAPLGTEFLVNQTTAGDQKEIGLACDWLGNFVICWEDWSLGTSRIMARRYDYNGLPLGDEFLVRAATSGNVRLPHVAVDEAGEDFVFAYTAPYEGPPRGGTPQTDIFARRWSFRPITEVTPPVVGGDFHIGLHFPGGTPTEYYFLIASLATSPGIPLPDGRELALTEDILFTFTLYPQVFDPTGNMLVGWQGFLDAFGQSSAILKMPFNPNFIGLEIFLGAITLDTTKFGLANQLRHVTDAQSVILVP